jgi:hypothetical protein
MRLSPLGTSATNWPIVPAPDDRWWVSNSSRWNENCRGKLKYSQKTYPSATLSTTNSTWPDLGSNPGCRGGKPAITAWAMTRSNDPVSSLDYVTPKNAMVNECWIGKDTEGSGHGLILGTIPAYAWRNWRKPRKMSVMISDVSVKTLTGHLPNAALLLTCYELQESDKSNYQSTPRV